MSTATKPKPEPPAPMGASSLAWTYNDVVRETGLGRRTIEKMVSNGQFPAPREATGQQRKTLLFDVDEVRAWFRSLPRHQSA